MLIVRAALVAVLAAAGQSGTAQADTRVTRDATPGSYVRYDGGTDATMLSCSTGRRTQNEPSVAVDPRNAAIVVAGSNDYCAEIQNGSGNVWAGYYRSTNGGATWSNSLVPGYPPTPPRRARRRRRTGAARRPEIRHRRSTAPVGCSTASSASTAPSRRTARCTSRLRPGRRPLRADRARGPRYASVWGLFQDKINVTRPDRSSGNVYVLWAQYPGQSGNNTLHFARSTDHGETFSKPVGITPGLSEEQFADATVGPDGTLYVTYRTIAHQKSTADAIWLVRSTEAATSWSAPQLVASITPFDSNQFSGNGLDTCGDGPFACPSGLTFARFSSMSAVAADATGVHVVYSAETAAGQAKIFVRNSPDGLDLADGVADARQRAHRAPVLPRHRVARRDDLGRLPGLPQGPGVLARPAAGRPGGRNQLRQRRAAILARSSNGVAGPSSSSAPPAATRTGRSEAPPLAVLRRLQLRLRRGEHGAAVWTDTRDLVPGSDPRETGADDDADGFDGFQTCTWVPTTSTRPPTARRRSPTPVCPRARWTRTSTSRHRPISGGGPRAPPAHGGRLGRPQRAAGRVGRERGGPPPASPQPARQQVRRPGDHRAGDGQGRHQRKQQDGRQDDEEDYPRHGEQEQGQQSNSDAGGEIDQLLEHLSERRTRGLRRTLVVARRRDGRCGRCVLHRP